MSTSAPRTAAPKIRRLKKGELLFAEGEGSKAMYFLRSGMIRLFKKKGESPIELDTVRSNQILGELAFLDGNPRSASAEALTDCELMEISGASFQEVMNHLPDWLKIMLKTVVTRLRNASTRIRQLETVSTAIDYSKDESKRTAHYVYLSPTEVLKACTAVLLAASRNGSQTPNGVEFKTGYLVRYGNQIMGVPAAKITTFLDILHQVQITATSEDENKAVLKDADFLEKLIAYLNDENLAESDKRHDLSPKGFLIMSLMMKHLAKYPKDENGISVVNIAEIRKSETPEGGKEPFRLEDVEELVRLDYATTVNMRSSSEALTTIKTDEFTLAYRLQRVAINIQAANEQKAKASGVRAA